MNLRFLILTAMGLAAILIAAACTPESPPPPVDSVGTLAAGLASAMLTQTASVPSPTPSPVDTATPSPSPTDTPTVEPTTGSVRRPAIKTFTGCYYGPGLEYGLDSNISENKKVEIVGIGSVPGWYVIVNPYFHKQCWVAASDLEVDPAMDLSVLPVMTPKP